MSDPGIHDVFFRAETLLQRQAAKFPAPSRSNLSADFRVHVWSSWNERAAQFAGQVEGHGATLFQSRLWLETWYETFSSHPDIDAVIVALERRSTGELVMLLPLCRRVENGLNIISFADFGLADYNAPLVHPDVRLDEQATRELMHEICKTLPDADLLKLEKIPHSIHKMDNPLRRLRGLQESNLCHYGIEISGSWDEYWLTLKRNFRKDQRRRWRVLEKKGEVSFLWCRDPEKILPLFEILLEQQHKRLHGLGLPYLLANPRMKQFYRQLLKKGCKDGPVIFTALLVDGQPVATLCGFGNGSQYAMTISGYETDAWSKCSPGRLLTERTMQTLHKQGYSYFDFTIGDEPYKKYFAMEHGPLSEFYRPLAWKALPRYSWMKVKAAQRKSKLVSALKKMLPGN